MKVLALIGVMAVVTYAMRALPLLLPGINRLPRGALAYLKLMAPTTLGALAATATVVPGGTWRLGIEAVAVAVSAAIIAWRGSLLAGILLAVAGVAAARALGW